MKQTKPMMEDKIISQIDVEKTKINEGSYLYFIPIWVLKSKKFP